MGANVWAVVGGSTFQLPMETLLGTAHQLLGMNAGATELQYKNAKFNSATQQFYVPVGSAGVPSYSFEGDLDTGMYRSSADELGWAIAGVNKANLGVATLSLGVDLRLFSKIIQEDFGANIAIVAGTTDLAPATGNVITLTNAAGDKVVTSLGGDTIPAGTEIETIFSISAGNITLQHNAVSLALLGNADILLVDGDIVRWRKTNDASPYWRMMSFQRGSSSPFASNFLPGFVIDRAGPNVPAGWLECDDSAVSRATYAALFAEIGITWGDGDGATTFNLPPSSGRARIGRGTGIVVDEGADAQVNIAANELIVPSNVHKWITGMSVVFVLSSGTVTGLTSGLTYYVIRMTATTISLASSLANAQNEIEIDFTAKAAPVWTITHTFGAKTLGEQGGEEYHAQKVSELLAHSHVQQGAAFTGGGSQFPATGTPTGPSPTGTSTTSWGGNQAMNIRSPYAVYTTIIKT